MSQASLKALKKRKGENERRGDTGVNDESDERGGYGRALVVIQLSTLESTVDRNRNRDGNLVSMVVVEQLGCIAVHTFIPMDLLISPYTCTHNAYFVRSLTERRRRSTVAPDTSPDPRLSFR